MTYEDLTINQRISLKGEIETNPDLKAIKCAKILFGFKKAVDFFLTDDISIFRDPLLATDFVYELFWRYDEYFYS